MPMRPASGRIDIERFLRDAAAFLRLGDEAQRTHVVQPVGKLHEQHAHVVGHRQHQLAEILCLLGALAEKFKLRKLGHPIDEIGDLLPEIFLHIFDGDVSVLHRVVQQRGHDGGGVKLEIGEDRRHFQRVREIRIARGAELLSVRLHGVDIGLVQQALVGIRIIGLHPLDQFGLAHQLALGLGRRGLGQRHGRAGDMPGHGRFGDRIVRGLGRGRRHGIPTI